MFAAFVTAALLLVCMDYGTDLLVPFTSLYMALIFAASQKVSPLKVYALTLVCLAGTCAMDMLLLDASGGHYVVLLFWRVLINAMSFFGTAWLCNSWNRVRQDLQRKSDRDFLTGLSNRRHFMQELEREIDIHCRSLQPFAIAFVDVDDFKVINDTLGHRRGDELLVEIASVLGHETRSIDLAGRYGGDEFVIFLREVSLAQSREIVERIHARLTQQLSQSRTPVTFSMGSVSFVLNRRIGAEELVAMADREMYRIKKRGKSGVSVVSCDLTDAALAAPAKSRVAAV
ncbi:GGDEF domain-containing protein [Amphibiibacter pelophylacis]|uniref:GGDEF domain-containing protein n=1 Tax=Amphibiibacter pelophylacis TaxID=1799477 RepID=A0ACC6NZ49_9BURK